MSLEKEVGVDLAIISYRKEAFERRFGCTVRDLMMIRALASLDRVKRVVWFERPDTIQEAVARLFWPRANGSKLRRHKRVDWNMIGQLTMRRKWTPRSFRLNEDGLSMWTADELPECRKVLLDFHPTYQPPVGGRKGLLYWYDMIDNFTKHNMYDAIERELTSAKYAFVKDHADVVTGVTRQCIEGFTNARVIANRLLREAWGSPALSDYTEYDLGFLGFITDKFDVAFIRRCASLGLKTLICGHVYHKVTAAQLASIKGVTMHGGFSAADSPALIQKFNVGLIPYLSDRTHDESPIKFFQYILSGKPVLLSRHFNDIEEDFSQYVEYYPELSDEQLLEFTRRGANSEIRTALATAAGSSPAVFWETAIADILQEVMKMSDTAAA